MGEVKTKSSEKDAIIAMQQLAPFNDGKNYLLAVIDTFTRYAFVRALKDKTGVNVLLR